MIIYSGGTFDLFHAGHVNLFRQCRALAGPGGLVVVALNEDAFVEAYKGHAPVQPYADRELLVSSCRYVDAVVPNVGGSDSRPAIEGVRPDVIAIGRDWFERDYHAQMGFDQAWLDERGIRIVYLAYDYLTSGRSSSQTIAHIRAS